MLTMNDDEFWEGVLLVEFGDFPALQDAMTVVDYPIGGDTISVASGVVLRMEILSYVHGSTEILGLQIDSAINSGNSGGPTFSDKGKEKKDASVRKMQITGKQLVALFLNCGQVVDWRVCRDPNSVLRFAFVEFTDEGMFWLDLFHSKSVRLIIEGTYEASTTI